MSRSENISRILSLLRPYRTKQIETFLSMVAAIVLSLLLPLVLRFLIDDVIGKKRADLLIPLVLVTLGIFAASAFFNFLTTYLFNVIGQHIVRDIRKQLFDHMTKLPINVFTTQGTGRIMSRILNDVSTIGRVVSSILLDFLIQSGTLIAIFGIMLYFNWRLTVLAFVSVPLYIVLIRYFNERLRRTSYETMLKHAEVSSTLQECITGIKEIRAYNREASESGRFLKGLTDFLRTRIRLGLLSSASVQIGFVVSSIGMLLVLLYGGNLVLHDRLSLGTLMAFWAYLGQVYTPINTLMRINVQFQEAAAAFRRIDEILTIKPAVTEKVSAVELAHPQGSIEFDNVTFSYDEGPPVLRGISLRISKGERVAIVGRSGSGKTTLASLLVRFFDPTAGVIRLDGIDLRDLKIADLRRAVALVSQDTFLFNASIAENIRFGREDATDEEVTEAARIAGVLEFAELLPEGLNTRVGERGVALSGGERQRIAIARAILKNPAVLVLDEATSQLDSRAEARLHKTLESVMVGRTSIMIAHRLSTISGAERILVLDSAKITEEGTHETLMARRGIYFSLYQEQATLQKSD